MKGQLAALVIAVTALNAGMVQADSRETCDAYRLEIIQLKAGLDQKYGENRVLLRDMNADPAARNALLAQYIVDPDNIRFRTLMDKFRADRRDECGWWTEADGKFN
jgi:hypothetical protein